MKRMLGPALCLLLLGALTGFLRWRQTSLIWTGGSARFSHLHSVEWNAATRQLRRTGEDPYLWLDLPATSTPIRDVTIEFGGPLADGPTKFYVYQYPAHLPGILFNDANLVLGRVQPTAGGYSIRWHLDDSKVVRLDLPDDLDAPVEIRRIAITSGFLGHWLGTVSCLLGLAALLLPLAAGLPSALHHRAWIEPAAVFALVGLKLLLASDLHLSVLSEARHDDVLFLRQAEAIMHGEWLGKYDEITLAKGPVYPLFLAGIGATGLPLLLTQALLHAAACLVLIRALRPLVPAAAVRLLLFTVLLFDPHTLSSEAVGRVLRSGIQPALTLFVLAGVIGLAARALRPLRIQLAWGTLGGVALALFWYSREEGVWLVPSLLVIAAAALGRTLRADRADRIRRVFALGLPALLLVAAFGLLRTVNAHFYGAPLTVDVRDGAFPRAYGALVRLTPVHPLSRVPVNRETREAAYAASPAFAELRPFLEGPVGARWVRVSHGAEPGGVPDGEIQGGWFQWALREAAAQAGHYRNAATADAYWSRVAAELNAASDAHRLPAGPSRTGFFPRWDSSRWGPARQALLGAAAVVARFADFSVQFPPQPSAEAERTRFTSIVHENIATSLAAPTSLSYVRLLLASVYRWAGTLLTVPAVLATAFAAWLAWQRRTGALRVAVLIALGGGALALMVVSALIDATSFGAIHAMYLAPATPLVLALWILAPYWLIQLSTDSGSASWPRSSPAPAGGVQPEHR